MFYRRIAKDNLAVDYLREKQPSRYIQVDSENTLYLFESQESTKRLM